MTIHRFDTIDTDILKYDGDPCPVRHCDLEEGHDGNHIDVNPYSGLVYYAWDANHRAVSNKALKLARQINSLRDAIIEAVDEASTFRHFVLNENINLDYDDDPALYKMIHDFDIWPHINDPSDSGFEGYTDDEIRSELVDLYELDGGEA